MYTTTEFMLGDLVVPDGASAAEQLGRLQDAALDATAPVSCAARPSTGFVHRDGACRCFTGGPAPEFPADTRPVYRFVS